MQHLSEDDKEDLFLSNYTLVSNSGIEKFIEEQQNCLKILTEALQTDGRREILPLVVENESQDESQISSDEVQDQREIKEKFLKLFLKCENEYGIDGALGALGVVCVQLWFERAGVDCAVEHITNIITQIKSYYLQMEADGEDS